MDIPVVHCLLHILLPHLIHQRSVELHRCEEVLRSCEAGSRHFLLFVEIRCIDQYQRRCLFGLPLTHENRVVLQ